MKEHDPDEFFSSIMGANNAFIRFRRHDPLPEIKPAMLNAKDIESYVRATGMLYPFHPKELAGATYPVRICGKCIRYIVDQDSGQATPQYLQLGEDQPDVLAFLEEHSRASAVKSQIKYEPRDELVLEPNSITYVTLEPVIQVPDYLILRFNLKIGQVYRGLLLGTGPIIDPGFRGRLSIPLHNLTNNKYTFYADQSLISMEFTKLSPYPEWSSINAGNEDTEGVKRTKYVSGTGYPYKDIDPFRDVYDYIQMALKNQGVKTVVSAAVETRSIAERSREHVDQVAKQSYNWDMGLGIALAAMLIALLTLFVSFAVPITQSLTSYADTDAKVPLLEARVEDLERVVDDLRHELEQRGGGTVVDAAAPIENNPR